MNTDEAWKNYRREYKRDIDKRDQAQLRADGKMFASEFARMNGVTPKVFRNRMRRAGYKRKGNSNLVPVKDLEKFL